MSLPESPGRQILKDPSLLSLGRISPTRLLMGHWFGNPFRVDPRLSRVTPRSYCPEEVPIFAQSIADINRIYLILRAPYPLFRHERPLPWLNLYGTVPGAIRHDA